jgi:hypothetical protein
MMVPEFFVYNCSPEKCKVMLYIYVNLLYLCKRIGNEEENNAGTDRAIPESEPLFN